VMRGSSVDSTSSAHIPEVYRGRVFGAYQTTNALISILGSLLAGLLADAVGSRPLLCVTRALFVASSGSCCM
jgi:MFS family permease